MAQVRSIDSARKVHLSRGVEEWLKTGRGQVLGAGYTHGGTPARNQEDLARALRTHFQTERDNASHLARFGTIDTKYATRSKTSDGQAFWLWITTSNGRGSHPKNVVIVDIDHG